MKKEKESVSQRHEASCSQSRFLDTSLGCHYKRSPFPVRLDIYPPNQAKEDEERQKKRKGKGKKDVKCGLNRFLSKVLGGNVVPRARLLSLGIHSSALNRDRDASHHLALCKAQPNNSIPPSRNTIQHHPLQGRLPHGINEVGQFPHLGAHATDRLDPKLDAILLQRTGRGAVDGADGPLDVVAGDFVRGGGEDRGRCAVGVVASGVVLGRCYVVEGVGWVGDAEGGGSAPCWFWVADAHSVVRLVDSADGTEH